MPLQIVEHRPYEVGARYSIGGVMRRIDRRGLHVWKNRAGVRWHHPVAQVQFCFALARGVDGMPTALTTAIIRRNIEELLARRTDGFLSYPFDFPLHGDATNTIHSPWWSGMAQGQLLSLLCRMEERGIGDYRADIERTLTTLATLHDPQGDAAGPWVTFRDAEGMLWFEEYAGDVAPMRVLNGHLFAVFGLYDAWRHTASTEAESLLLEGARTVAHYAERFRRAPGPTVYGLRIDTPIARSPKYHSIHIGQLLYLEQMTGDAEFGRIARDFASDTGEELPTLPTEL